MSRRTGIATSTISDWRKKKINPQADKLVSICKALDMSLVDFKVSKAPIKKEHTLQLLMYWRMGLHSIHPEFNDIQYLGIYNPRQNTVSRISVSDIPENVIKEVEKEVIGYNS